MTKELLTVIIPLVTVSNAFGGKIMVEDKKTEFKREYVEDVKKTLVAFANTDGGIKQY